MAGWWWNPLFNRLQWVWDLMCFSELRRVEWFNLTKCKDRMSQGLTQGKVLNNWNNSKFINTGLIHILPAMNVPIAFWNWIFIGNFFKMQKLCSIIQLSKGNYCRFAFPEGNTSTKRIKDTVLPKLRFYGLKMHRIIWFCHDIQDIFLLLLLFCWLCMRIITYKTYKTDTNPKRPIRIKYLNTAVM